MFLTCSVRSFRVIFDYCFIWTGKVALHVLMNLKRAFLSSLKSVALPPISCLTFYLALVCTIPSSYHACHDALAMDGNCYPPTVYIHHILFASTVRSSPPSHALLYLTFVSALLLSLSYWHRWKAVQYVYLSLLTRLSLATVASRSPSTRCRITICSLPDRLLLADARIRSLLNTPWKAAQCLSPIPFPVSVAATAELAMSLRQLVLLALFARRRRWVQASICWLTLAF
jgi:hypothetical protein